MAGEGLADFEAAEKANQQKLQSLKKQTQEYLLKQIEEKHNKRNEESERVKQLAQTQAIEERKIQDKEAEKNKMRRMKKLSMPMF